MCDKYPNCLHGSKVMAKLPGFTRHCKTTLPSDVRELNAEMRRCGVLTDDARQMLLPITPGILLQSDWIPATALMVDPTAVIKSHVMNLMANLSAMVNQQAAATRHASILLVQRIDNWDIQFTLAFYPLEA